MLWIGIASFLTAGAAAWLVTPLVVRLAGRLGAHDMPGGRKRHAAPVPRIGGVAVFVGFVAGLLFAAAATNALGEGPRAGVYWYGLAAAATGMFLVGFADDLFQISFRWKLLAQIAAAASVWAAGFSIEVISHPLGGNLDLGWLSLPITILWIVGITNAVNLIDGLDGLAAGTAVIMTTAIAVIATFQGKLGVTAACVALAGSLVGFLWYNFNPARVYLGDSGSLFVGFTLAVTSIRGSQKGPAVVAIFIPLLVLGLPLLDTSFAVVRRALKLGNSGRESGSALRYIVRNVDHIFMPDTGHIHHRLLDLGLSHRGAVVTLYGVVMLMVGVAFALVLWKSLIVAGLLLGVLLLLFVVFARLLYFRSRSRRDDDSAAESRPKDTVLATAPPVGRFERR